MIVQKSVLTKILAMYTYVSFTFASLFMPIKSTVEIRQNSVGDV
jgi:hypothetical protein